MITCLKTRIDVLSTISSGMLIAHSSEQTTFTRLSPPGTHFTAESTEGMRIKSLAQGYNILVQWSMNCRSMNTETDFLLT